MGIPEQTPGDPAVTNVWGANLNSGLAILDLVGGGTLSLSVAGNSNVILTNTPGTTGQSLNANFDFTGALTGNIIVFWPLGVGRMFSVMNNTTGAFTLTCAVNNGSGSPEGLTVGVPQGASAMLGSNGTDVFSRISALAITGLGQAATKAVSDNTKTTVPTLGNVVSGSIVSFADSSGTLSSTLSPAGFLQTANNLSDLEDAATARTNLDLGSAATQSTSAFDAAGAASTAQSNAETYALGLITALPNGSTTAITVSTSAPSGSGNNGDLWLRH